MTGEIIGRDAELDTVRAFLDRPSEGLRALVLEGDAGIGKSTVWLAAVEAVRDRSFLVLTSRPAEAERALAYVVLGDLFGEIAPEVLAALPAPRRRAFQSALLREESAFPVDPRALGVAIQTILPLLTDGRPLVLAIDDDQWVDPASAAILGFALRRSVRQPVLLLLARRSDTAPAIALEETIDPVQVQGLHVGPLSVGAIQVLIGNRLGIAVPRPALLQIHEGSGGNPFYALELARARSADPARDATVPLLVPASLERLIGARIEALDEGTRRVLLLIATRGRLPIELLRALEVAPEALDAARAAKVVETAGAVVRFTHPLLASAVYHGATDRDRRSAHLRLATAFDDPVDSGRHLALATDEPDETIATALETAVGAARTRGTPIAAAELAEHAVRLTPSSALDDRHRRAILAARAHLESGEGSRALAIADDLLAQAPRGAKRAEALVLRSEMEVPGRAVALLQEALAEAAGVPALEAAIHAVLARDGRMMLGRSWAEPHAEAALRLAQRLDDDALRVQALSILAVIRFERADAGGLEAAERAYDLAVRLDDPAQLKVAASAVRFVLMFSGNARARDWLERQLDHWRDRDEQVRAELLWALAWVEVWFGRWTLAGDYAEQVREINMQYGETSPDHLSPSLIAMHRGQFSVARDHSRRALAMARGHLLPQHLAILGICDLWGGSPAAGIAYLAQADETADRRGWDDPNMRWWRAESIEALLQLGRVDDAVHLLDEWEAAAGRLGSQRVLALALRCRGLVAAAGGDLSTAVELLEAAADRHEAVGDPFGRARALLALGTVRRRARQKRTARTALEAALAGFDVLGAPSWAATARTELARIGGRTRMEGLSPSEIGVAALVARGLTNREIASTLFVGERTVASHLTHIYSKLGFIRTELARHPLSEAASPAGDSSNIPTS